MKLISTSQLIESTFENFFTRKIPDEVSTLIASQKHSAIDVIDGMMKEAKVVEDSSALSASGFSNGQIETLNGVSPKPSQKISDINKSSLSFDVTVRKVTIPAQWEKLNLSSSRETLPREVVTNGISPDSTHNKESDNLSDDDMERNSLGFDFVDDSEKFGLSDSEVDKILKDVDDKEKSDVPKSTKSDRKENGIEQDSNNETLSVAAGGASEKSGNLADMLLSNFEKQLQSGFDISVNNSILNKLEQNHISEKEIAETCDVPQVLNTNNTKGDVIDTLGTLNSNNELSVDNDSNIVKESVTESSLSTEEITENTSNKLKQDTLEEEGVAESSHSKIVEHESKENENCSKSDDSCKGYSSNSKPLEKLGSNEKLDDSEDEDSCNRGVGLLENSSISGESLDKELFDEVSNLKGSILSDDSQDKASSNKTNLSDCNSGSLQVDKNEPALLETDKNSNENESPSDDVSLDGHVRDRELKSTEENDTKGDSDIEMKNLELEENDTEGDLESEMRIDEADKELDGDSLDGNDAEMQDIAPSSEKSLDIDDVDTYASEDDSEMPILDREASVESGMHTEVTENSLESEIQDEKVTELGSNPDDSQNECVDFPSNVSKDVEEHEQIPNTEITSNSVAQIEEKDSSELELHSTDEKEPTGEINLSNAVIDNENSMVEPEQCKDNNEAERLVRKRTSDLENGAERDIKRTKVAENNSDGSDGIIECREENDNDGSDAIIDCSKENDSAIEKEGAKVLDRLLIHKIERKDANNKTENIKNVEEVKEFIKEHESEGTKSDSVCDKKDIKECGKRCIVEKDVQDNSVTKESDIVRTGTKRLHEQVGLIEVKKVRITPEMENQLSKLSSSEKLQKRDSSAKVLVDKSATKSTNDQNDKHKKTDSESGSLTESKDEISNSSKDVVKRKENLPVVKDSTKEESEEKQTKDKDSSAGKLDKNTSVSNKLDNEKKTKDIERTTSSELTNSLPPRSPKSNLDLAIERVVLGITDDSRGNADADKEPKKLNAMPFMRNLQDNLLKKLSRYDLEELFVQKMCEAVTDRCTLGDTRQRCQTLEQMLEQWRKKVQQLQKQLKDMEMVMKRYIGDARTRKERPIPVKITRSVGLQVHMGPVNAGMLRNRPMSNDPSRNQGQMRRRANRVSSPTVAGTTQQNQQQSTQSQQQQQSSQPSSQQAQRQTPQVSQGGTPTAAATPVTVQKVVTPGFTKLVASSSPQVIAPRPNITTAASMPTNKVAKIAPSPIKPVGRPITSIAAAITTGPATSTVNTMNNTVVSTANNLRIASAAQLNNRQPAKPTTFATGNKSGDLIDLTGEEDRAKTNNVRAVNPVASTVTAGVISTSPVTSGVPITAGGGIQAGSIRVVQPHQLTGTTTTTLLAPSSPASANSRLAYFVPTSGGSVQQRQVLITSSGGQVRPGVMNVQNRQNQLPTTLVFKNGTVVPIQQASGTQSVNTAILRPGPPMQAGQLQQVIPRPGQPIRVAPSLVTTVGRMTTPTITNVPVLTNKHPAPLPNPPVYQPSNPNWKLSPPKPELKISKGANKHQQGIVLSWNMTLTSDYEEIASYQLYAYQEGSAQPSTTLWKKVGDVKALPLPMACTLTQFMEGHKYHFAVRAVDVHMRVGPFSTPGNIVLTRK